MKAIESVIESYQKSKTGEQGPRQFFATVLQNMVILNSEERLEMLKLTKDFAADDEFLHAHHEFCQGMEHVYTAKFREAINSCSSALAVFDKHADAAGCMSCNTMISISHRSMGQLDKAQRHMTLAVDHLNRIKDQTPFYYFQSVTCYQAGELAQSFRKYDEAEKHYSRGLEFLTGSEELRARLFSSLAMNYMFTQNMAKAKENLDLALGAVKNGTNLLLESKVYSDLGTYYLRNKELDEALRNQLISLEIREKNGMRNPASTNYILLAETYMEMGNMDKAVEFGNKAIERCIELNTVIKLFEAYLVLSKIHEKKGDHRSALENYKLYIRYKEEVHNQETMRKIEQINSEYKIENSEKEKEIFRLRNVELKGALDEIHDSFTYARRIQNSLLASEKYIANSLKRLMN